VQEYLPGSRVLSEAVASVAGSSEGEAPGVRCGSLQAASMTINGATSVKCNARFMLLFLWSMQAATWLQVIEVHAANRIKSGLKDRASTPTSAQATVMSPAGRAPTVLYSSLAWNRAL